MVEVSGLWEDSLGEVLDEFHTAGSRVILSSGLLALGLGLLALLGLVRASFQEAEVNIRLRLGGLALIFLVGGLLVLRRVLGTGSLRVIVRQRGLVWIRGERSLSLRWQNVVIVRRESEPERVELLDAEGWCFAFDKSLARLTRFQRLVEESTLEPLLTRARDALAAGELVEFGSLGASQRGLHHGDTLLAWKDCAGLEEGRGLLSVHSRVEDRPFARVEMARVYNIHVLQRLIERMKEEGGGP